MRKFYLVITLTIFATSFAIGQTITPIYFTNDSIDFSKLQFINPKTGNILKSKVDGQLVDITEDYPDTIQIVIPFKDGTQVILYKVETKYLDISCVINVRQNSKSSQDCSSIVYCWGDLIRIRYQGLNCDKEMNSVDIVFNSSNYSEKTKTLGINLLDRLNSKEYFERLKKRHNDN